MPRIALTDLSIRSLKNSSTRTDFWDTKLPAFGVRVGERSKTFVVKHSNRRFTLGRFPDDMSLAEARVAAKKILAHTPPAKASLTFKEALNLFLDTHGSSIRPRTLYDYQKALKRHFLPKLRAIRLDEITTAQTTAIIDRLTKDTPSEANHAFMYARTFFRWAQKRRYIVRSPLDGLSLPTKSPSRSRVLADAELKSIWAATEEPTHFNRIVRLLLLTGQRRSEIAGLRKEWICQNTISLPSENTKNGYQHAFPIGTLASAVLDGPLKKSQTLLFPAIGKDEKPFNGWSKSKAALDKASGVSEWTLHDLRRTYATNLAKLGVQLPVIEKLLNHVSGSFGGIVAVYQHHSFMPEMREAVAKYENWFTALISA